ALLVDAADADHARRARRAGGLVIVGADRARRQRLALDPDEAFLAVGRLAVGRGDAQLDAADRLADRRRVLAGVVERDGRGLGRVVTAPQPDAVLVVELVGDQLLEPRAGGEVARLGEVELLRGRQLGQLGVELRGAGQDIDLVLADELADAP